MHDERNSTEREQNIPSITRKKLRRETMLRMLFLVGSSSFSFIFPVLQTNKQINMLIYQNNNLHVRKQ